MAKGKTINIVRETTLTPISLEIQLNGLRERNSLANKLEQEDTLTFLANFYGCFNFYLNGRNVFSEGNGRVYQSEPLTWLYWLLAEKDNFSNPGTYILNAPQEYLKIERARTLPRETRRFQTLREWAAGHVLANYLTSAPYMTFQTPDREILELTWDFEGKPLIEQRGKANVSLQDFLSQLNKLGLEYKEKLEKEFLGIKEKEFFKKFVGYLG